MSRAARIIAGMLLLIGTVAVAARAPCRGRWLVRGVAPETIVLVLDERGVTLEGLCPTTPGRLRTNRRRTIVRATWDACGEHTGVRLRARLDRTCNEARGTVRFDDQPTVTFTAASTRCGDTVLDRGAGERCDDGNRIGGDGCDAICDACPTPNVPFAHTWDAVREVVFLRGGCLGCHGELGVGGIDLRGDPYDRLVGVVVPEGPGLMEIAPGNPDASFLWLKLAKALDPVVFDPVPGPAMPIGGILDAAVIDALRTWIAAGAPHRGIVDGTDALAPCTE